SSSSRTHISHSCTRVRAGHPEGRCPQPPRLSPVSDLKQTVSPSIFPPPGSKPSHGGSEPLPDAACTLRFLSYLSHMQTPTPPGAHNPRSYPQTRPPGSPTASPKEPPSSALRRQRNTRSLFHAPYP